VTHAERLLVLACAARAAELWAAGHEQQADRWATAAFKIAGNHEFLDVDDEVAR
jgi:hypothetical protein